MTGMQQFLRSVRNAVPPIVRASAAWRLLRACYHFTQFLPEFRIRFAQLARAGRLVLLAAGLPLKRQFLVLRCLEGKQSVGLFSEVFTVLGALDHYERWRTCYAGLSVDFPEGGLYYEPTFGRNWWEYYFEPIYIGSSDGAVISPSSLLQHDVFQFEGDQLSRKRGFELINRYIRPKPHIRDKVESLVRDDFRDAFVVGIHFRGNDHFVESPPRIPYEQVRAAVRDSLRAAESARCKLFIATDERPFLEYMVAMFPEALIYRPMYRSADGQPIDVVNADGNHKKGEDAVIDCLLLSRCQYLLRTESSLSICSTLFNPELPQILINRPPG
jgi:hypothetical protein